MEMSFGLMLLTASNLIDIWLNQESKIGVIVMNIITSPTVPCIIGSLPMFRLKEVAQRGVNGGMSISMSINIRTASTMAFS